MRTTIPDWSKFDCILAMSFTQYRDRAEKSDDELSRVGLGVKSQFSPENQTERSGNRTRAKGSTTSETISTDL